MLINFFYQGNFLTSLSQPEAFKICYQLAMSTFISTRCLQCHLLCLNSFSFWWTLNLNRPDKPRAIRLFVLATSKKQLRHSTCMFNLFFIATSPQPARFIHILVSAYFHSLVCRKATPSIIKFRSAPKNIMKIALGDSFLLHQEPVFIALQPSFFFSTFNYFYKWLSSIMLEQTIAQNKSRARSGGDGRRWKEMKSPSAERRKQKI